MKYDEQAKTAFALWQNIAKLKKMLWDRYDKEFLQLLLDIKEEEDKQKDSNSEDFVF